MMYDKVCLITGGTNGIGKSAALALARMGATVVLVGRDPTKTNRVVAEIRAASGNGKIEGLTADLSAQREVRDLAAAFQRRHDRLDVLLNNAGGVFLSRRLSVDGLEMTFALNHLAYFLLTLLLLDTLRASAPARIINVASGAHAQGRIDFDDLQGERAHGSQAYADSKLANVLFTFELARRLEGTGVTVNALHPGFVATGFARNDGKVLAALVGAIAPLVARSPARGARTPVYLASSPEVEGVTGSYFRDARAVRPAPAATDPLVARRLWERSAELVGWAPTKGPLAMPRTS